MSTQQDNFRAIADKIREKTGSEDLIKPSAFADKVDEVYDAGQKAEYDRFWDNAQNYGKQTNYKMTFAGRVWDDKNFYPKYSMTPDGATNMFQEFNMDGITFSLVERLNEQGITLDTSKIPDFDNLFYSCKVSEIPSVNTTNATRLRWVFSNAKYVKTIEALILKDDGSQTFTDVFSSCTALENLTIEGTIGQTGFNVRWSTNLTVASMLSILTALSKDSAVASGKSITFSTAHQEVIEADAECLEQLNLAIAAGWTIAYA